MLSMKLSCKQIVLPEELYLNNSRKFKEWCSTKEQLEKIFAEILTWILPFQQTTYRIPLLSRLFHSSTYSKFFLFNLYMFCKE